MRIKEKQTFEMMKMTTLSPAALITGELLVLGLSAGILIVSSLPVIGLILLVGGVSPSEIGVLYIALFLTTLILGSYGLLNATMQNKAYRAQAGTVSGMVLPGILLFLLFYNNSTALLVCINPLVLFNSLSRVPLMISFFNGSVSLLPAMISLSLLATLLFIIIASRKAYDVDKPALRHRLILNFAGEAERISPDSILEEIVRVTPLQTENRVAGEKAG